MKLKWDNTGERFFETGISNGVLYVKSENGYADGVAWNGLTSVSQSPTGAEESSLYADNIKYLSLRSAEEFTATIEAYTYPEEFEVCDGTAELGVSGIKVSQQPRKSFCFVYKTKKGNDVNSDLGYKIHLIYNATAAPSERAYETVNESPEAITFSWELTTVPVAVSGMSPSAHVEIDSTKLTAAQLAAVEAELFGTDAVGEGAGTAPHILMPDELLTLVSGVTGA